MLMVLRTDRPRVRAFASPPRHSGTNSWAQGKRYTQNLSGYRGGKDTHVEDGDDGGVIPADDGRDVLCFWHLGGDQLWGTGKVL